MRLIPGSRPASSEQRTIADLHMSMTAKRELRSRMELHSPILSIVAKERLILL